MDSFATIIAINLAAVITMMFIGWLFSIVKRNVNVVDSLWGLGFVLIAWLTFFLAEGFLARKLLIALMVSFWGIRLSIYLTWRNWAKSEDARYGSWRTQIGKKFWYISLFKVFLLQALFMWVIALGPQYGQVAQQPGHLTWLDALGFMIWLTGFVYESLSDWQLARFKADLANRGKVMNRGLWAYSRHPNYFGEFLVWWGLFMVTLNTPLGWWTIGSPLIVTLVLLKMTGIPLTERAITNTRPGYKRYIRETNAFIPWFRQRKETRAC